jgi:hypothetical protein
MNLTALFCNNPSQVGEVQDLTTENVKLSTVK